MKTYLIFQVISLCLSINACAQNQPETFDDGTPMYSMDNSYTKYDNGLTYYLNGEEQPYSGLLFAKYDNGNLQSVQQLENGKGSGFWIDYAPDGRIECKGTFINNRVEGPVTFYYEDGSVKSEGKYRSFKKPIGLWKFYDRQGNVVSERIYTR